LGTNGNSAQTNQNHHQYRQYLQKQQAKNTQEPQSMHSTKPAILEQKRAFELIIAILEAKHKDPQSNTDHYDNKKILQQNLKKFLESIPTHPTSPEYNQKQKFCQYGFDYIGKKEYNGKNPISQPISEDDLKKDALTKLTDFCKELKDLELNCNEKEENKLLFILTRQIEEYSKGGNMAQGGAFQA